jgi:LysR family hydrogen peroxide-inducible transcriptional activator
MPSGHPLAKESLIDPEQIAVENLLLLGIGNCFRDQVVQACPQLSCTWRNRGCDRRKFS